jgi:uncharacterized protein YrzB (UPF0473 family)
MLQDNQMIVTDQDCNESVCEILFTHEHEGKNYVVFDSSIQRVRQHAISLVKRTMRII